MSVRQNNAPVSFRHRISYGAIRGALWLLLALPYRSRLSFMAGFMCYVVGPIAGYDRRTMSNLSTIFPELPVEERRKLVRKVSKNVGRTLAELFSPNEFKKRAPSSEISGPGLAALEEARAQGRPSILVSGHFGNYDAVRATLIDRGFNVGGLYRRMRNPLFHRFYIDRISAIGTPLFERGKPGLAQMVRHLKGGGTLAALIDVRARSGVPLQFFGRPAWTPLSMTKLAVKYNAVIVPCYGIRKDDGASFKVVLEAPLEHADAVTMMQELNDSLERRIRENVDQWLWYHNRWKDYPDTDLQDVDA